MKPLLFFSRFLIHLIIMVSVCLLVSKLYYLNTPFIELIDMQKEFVWIFIIAALITALIGQRYRQT